MLMTSRYDGAEPRVDIQRFHEVIVEARRQRVGPSGLAPAHHRAFVRPRGDIEPWSGMHGYKI